MERIPTENFDTSKHVISCREAETGRQVWVTLESLAEAERVIERVYEPQTVAPADTSGFATKDDLVLLQSAMAKAVSEALPPADLSTETLSALTEVGRALANLAQRVADLEEYARKKDAEIDGLKQAVDIHDESLEFIRRRGAA